MAACRSAIVEKRRVAKTEEVGLVMPRDAIRDKLEAILRGAPRSEAEVVYVLVEIRKFLEREGKTKEAQFSTLKFFCDWVAHVKLSFGGAKKVLARLDAQIGSSGQVDASMVQPNSELYRLMSLEPLLEEIKLFCSENSLPTQWAFDPTMWCECMRFYGHIVLNCPLDITRGNASGRYIKRLTLTNAVDLQDHPDKRAFSWDWCFELSDGHSFVLHHEFSYPSPSYDPSRPTTVEFGF
jgi:hypothetical protein